MKMWGREAVPVCFMCEFVRRTKRRHRLRGELSNEVRLRGNISRHFGSELFPFRHGFAMPLSPHAGTAFG